MGFLFFIFLVALFFGGMALSQILNGFVLSQFWAWFVVPAFHLPLLTVAQAIGLACFFAVANGSTGKIYAAIKESQKKKEYDGTGGLRAALWDLAAVMFFQPLFVLFFGWIIHECIN